MEQRLKNLEEENALYQQMQKETQSSIVKQEQLLRERDGELAALKAKIQGFVAAKKKEEAESSTYIASLRHQAKTKISALEARIRELESRPVDGTKESEGSDEVAKLQQELQTVIQEKVKLKEELIASQEEAQHLLTLSQRQDQMLKACEEDITGLRAQVAQLEQAKNGGSPVVPAVPAVGGVEEGATVGTTGATTGTGPAGPVGAGTRLRSRMAGLLTQGAGTSKIAALLSTAASSASSAQNPASGPAASTSTAPSNSTVLSSVAGPSSPPSDPSGSPNGVMSPGAGVGLPDGPAATTNGVSSGGGGDDAKYDKLKRERDTLKAAKDEAEKENRRLTASNKELVSTLGRLEQVLDSVKREREALHNLSQQQLTQLTKLRSEVESGVSEEQTRVESFKHILGETENKHKAEVDRLKGLLDGLKQERARLGEELALPFLAQIEGLKQTIASVSSERDGMKKARDDAANRLALSQGRVTSVSEELKHARTQLAQALADKDKVLLETTTIQNTLESKCSELHDQIVALQRERRSQRASMTEDNLSSAATSSASSSSSSSSLTFSFAPSSSLSLPLTSPSSSSMDPLRELQHKRNTAKQELLKVLEQLQVEQKRNEELTSALQKQETKYRSRVVHLETLLGYTHIPEEEVADGNKKGSGTIDESGVYHQNNKEGGGEGEQERDKLVTVDLNSSPLSPVGSAPPPPQAFVDDFVLLCVEEIDSEGAICARRIDRVLSLAKSWQEHVAHHGHSARTSQSQPASQGKDVGSAQPIARPILLEDPTLTTPTGTPPGTRTPTSNQRRKNSGGRLSLGMGGMGVAMGAPATPLTARRRLSSKSHMLPELEEDDATKFDFTHRDPTETIFREMVSLRDDFGKLIRTIDNLNHHHRELSEDLAVEAEEAAYNRMNAPASQACAILAYAVARWACCCCSSPPQVRDPMRWRKPAPSFAPYLASSSNSRARQRERGGESTAQPLRLYTSKPNIIWPHWKPWGQKHKYSRIG